MAQHFINVILHFSLMRLSFLHTLIIRFRIKTQMENCYMGVIFNLTIRYMKKNRKRTTAAIAGIMGTMIILTAVKIFSSPLFNIIKKKNIIEERKYHAEIY